MGLYRLGGSAGWAVMCLIAGLVASLYSSYLPAFDLATLLSAAAFLVSLGLTDPQPSTISTAVTDQARSSATLSNARAFYASVFLGSLGIGATSSFVTILLSELGGDPVTIGVVLAVGAAVEVPAMYYGGRLTDKYGSLWVLSAGMTGMAVSYVLYGWVGMPMALVFVQAIRGLFYGFFTVSGMTMSSSLGGAERGGFHAGLYGLISTLGSSSGPSLGGLVSDQCGLKSMFVLSSVVSLLAASLAGWAALTTRIKGPAHPENDRGESVG